MELAGIKKDNLHTIDAKYFALLLMEMKDKRDKKWIMATQSQNEKYLSNDAIVEHRNEYRIFFNFSAVIIASLPRPVR